MLKRLNAEKAAFVAASQTVAVAAPQHIALTAASKVFIDTFAAAYVGASLASRKMLVEHIIAAASGVWRRDPWLPVQSSEADNVEAMAAIPCTFT